MPKYVDVEKIHAQIMDAFETALEVIETENAVELPDRPKGRWEWCKNHYECTNCRGSRFHDLVLGLDAQYCGRCGADMREV